MNHWLSGIISIEQSIVRNWTMQSGRVISRLAGCTNKAIVHFKRLGSRVSHDSFNQYVFFFSKQCTYCQTNAIYT